MNDANGQLVSRRVDAWVARSASAQRGNYQGRVAAARAEQRARLVFSSEATLGSDGRGVVYEPPAGAEVESFGGFRRQLFRHREHGYGRRPDREEMCY